MCPTGSFNACDSEGHSTFAVAAPVPAGISGVSKSGCSVGDIGGTGVS